jgi:hypothetical protein
MQVIFTPAARAELVEAQEWYEARHRGLGIQFLEQVGATVLRIKGEPPPVPGGFSRCPSRASA